MVSEHMIVRGALFLVACLVCEPISFAASSAGVVRQAIAVVPSGWESSVNEWATYRKSQGIEILIIPSQSTCDQTKASIKRHAQERNWLSPTILLGADAIPINQWHELDDGEPYVPTFYLPSEAIIQFGGEAEIATDYPYGDLDDDGIAECAVGRLPASSAEQLKTMLHRSIVYERDTIRGTWLYEMNMTAGSADSRCWLTWPSTVLQRLF